MKAWSLICVAAACVASGAWAEDVGFAENQTCESHCSGGHKGLGYWFNRLDHPGGKFNGKMAKSPGEDAKDLSPLTDTVISLSCTKDPLDDSKLCVVMNIQEQADGKSKVVYSTTYKGDRAQMLVCVGYKHYPGSDVRIRYDSAAPISHKVQQTGGCIAVVSAGLLKASKVTTEFAEWPKNNTVVTVGDTAGLKEALDLADFLLARL